MLREYPGSRVLCRSVVLEPVLGEPIPIADCVPLLPCRESEEDIGPPIDETEPLESLEESVRILLIEGHDAIDVRRMTEDVGKPLARDQIGEVFIPESCVRIQTCYECGPQGFLPGEIPETVAILIRVFGAVLIEGVLQIVLFVDKGYHVVDLMGGEIVRMSDPWDFL